MKRLVPRRNIRSKEIRYGETTTGAVTISGELAMFFRKGKIGTEKGRNTKDIMFSKFAPDREAF